MGKKAGAEYTKLQAQITELQKKLNPFKKFKQELQQRIAARKRIAELAEKLETAELEIEKAAMMMHITDDAQMPEDEIKQCEETARSAQGAAATLTRLVQQCGRTNDAALNSEIEQLSKIAQETKSKLDAVNTTLRKQRIGLSTEKAVIEAKAKMSKAEEAMKKCEEAEMPFLRGIEVLPADESTKAISESERAAQGMDAALNAVNTYIKQQIASANTHSPEVKDKVVSDFESITRKG